MFDKRAEQPALEGGAGQRPPGQRTLLSLLLLAHYPVPVCVAHVLIGGVPPVDQRYAMGPGLGTGDPAVLVVVPYRKGVHVRWRRLIPAGQGVRVVYRLYFDLWRLVAFPAMLDLSPGHAGTMMLGLEASTLSGSESR